MNCKLIFAVITIAGGSAFHHGFHAALLNILLTVIVQWYTQLQEERNHSFEGFYNIVIIGPFFVASFALGAIVGSLLIWMFSEFLGRKFSLIANNVIAFVALLIQSFSYLLDSFELLIIGRFMIGICAGLGSGIAPMYLVEISPYCIRGTVCSSYYVMVAASMAVGHIFGLNSMLGDKDGWPLIFIFCFIPTAIQVVSLLVCPESPKYLYFNKHDEYEAEEALTWLRDDEIQEELEDYKEEDEILTDNGPVTFQSLFSLQILRSPVIISSVIFFGQQVCGIDGMIYFSTYIFMSMEYNFGESLDLGICLTIANLLGSVVGMVLMDKVGRKGLLMGSFGGMLFCLICLGFTIMLSSVKKVPPDVVHVATFFIYLYMFVYALGAGTIPWFYAAELNNHYARPLAMTIGLTINWATNFVVVMSFFPLFKSIGNYIFFIFFVCNLVVLLFVAMTMRETMYMETTDIMELFYDD